jgi:hypothetical protein
MRECLCVDRAGLRWFVLIPLIPLACGIDKYQRSICFY